MNFRQWSGLALLGFAVSSVPATLLAAQPKQPQQPKQLVPLAQDDAAKKPEPVPAAKKEKRDEFAFKPITAIQLQTPPPGKTNPPDVAADFFARDGAPHAMRFSTLSEYSWVAPGVCHRPLYFEEINLERHGLSFGIAQPAVSTAQFLGRTLALPYLITTAPHRECVYTLGHDRPGKRVPYYIYCPPLDPRAATVESAAVAGAILLIP